MAECEGQEAPVQSVIVRNPAGQGDDAIQIQHVGSRRIATAHVERLTMTDGLTMHRSQLKLRLDLGEPLDGKGEIVAGVHGGHLGADAGGALRHHRVEEADA